MNVVITGGTRGIGRGLVEYLLKEGHNVTYTGTTENSIKNSFNGLSGNYHGVVCDVREVNDLKHLVYEATTRFGDINVWFNNAGVNQKHGLIQDLSVDEINRVMDINTRGMMIASKIALEQLLKQNSGILYNMEGLGSDGRMYPGSILYGTSKNVVRYFTKGLELETKDSNVRIGRISPGMVYTDLLQSDLEETSSKIIDILADDVETVSTFIGKNIEQGKQNIFWLTPIRAFKKFMTYPFKKHK